MAAAAVVSLGPATWWLLATLSFGSDPLGRHQELYRAARSAESARNYPEAVSACEEAVAISPTGPRAATCRARLAWLEARRDADGTWASLAELQAVREAYRSLAPGEGARRVRALRDRPGVAELVWVDAGLWLGRDALDRGDPAEALAITEPIVARHHGELRRSAVGVHTLALAAAGRLDEALVAEQEIRVAPPGVRDTPIEQQVRARTERRWATASAVAVGAFAVVAAPLAWIGRHRDGRPWGLVPIGVAVGGAWAIGEGWTEGAAAAAPYLLLGFSAIYLIAGPALQATDARWRPVVRALAALATLGVAVLAFYATNTLDWVTP